MTDHLTVAPMETSPIDLSIVCGQCGDSRLTLQTAEDGATHAVCGGCAADLGAWDEVLEHARAAMFDALRDDLAGMIRPRPDRADAPASLPLAA